VPEYILDRQGGAAHHQRSPQKKKRGPGFARETVSEFSGRMGSPSEWGALRKTLTHGKERGVSHIRVKIGSCRSRSKNKYQTEKKKAIHNEQSERGTQ